MKLFIALLFALIVASAHTGEAATRFLFTYGAIGGNAMPLWIAQEQGIFRKYDLEPQLIYIIAGRAMQSMLAGDIQVGLLGATHVTNAVTAGIAAVLKFMTQHGLNPKAADLKPEDIADMSVCKKLEESGFFARLQ